MEKLRSPFGLPPLPHLLRHSSSALLHDSSPHLVSALYSIFHEGTCLTVIGTEGVRATSSAADYRISVDILENIHTNQVMLVFMILTFGLFPSTSSAEFVATTVIRDRTDKEVFRTTKQEGMSTVVELFALFWLNSGLSMPRQIVYDLSRATLAEAAAKGVFN